MGKISGKISLPSGTWIWGRGKSYIGISLPLSLRSPQHPCSMKTKRHPSTQSFTEADIAGMLQKIPPHPPYSEWMKILSAVFSVLPFAQGARLLNQWSPEKYEGEYFRKHRQRLKQIGIGSLVMLAKQNGWAGAKSTQGKVLIRHSPVPTSRNKAPSWIPKISPTAPEPTRPPAAEIDMGEAQRLASELLKMHEAGSITGPDDPNARIYAKALRLFRASFHMTGGTKESFNRPSTSSWAVDRYSCVSDQNLISAYSNSTPTQDHEQDHQQTRPGQAAQCRTRRPTSRACRFETPRIIGLERSEIIHVEHFRKFRSGA